MDPFQPKPQKGPEAKVQEQIVKFLKLRDWFVQRIHGNKYQAGMPDLFICSRRFGSRWLEIKLPTGSIFTADQREVFPAMTAAGVGIWIMTAASEAEYAKLWRPANWYQYFHEGNLRDRRVPKTPPPEIPGPEAKIQKAVIKKLTEQGWFVKELIGSMYQTGLPDLFAARKGDGSRFIELKNPKNYRFQGTQLELFPRFQAEGVGIWILTSDDDSEIKKLHSPPNWHEYLKGQSNEGLFEM